MPASRSCRLHSSASFMPKKLSIPPYCGIANVILDSGRPYKHNERDQFQSSLWARKPGNVGASTTPKTLA